MKTVKLKTRDAYDLYLVTSGIINTKSNDIDFKDIISLQKVASFIKEEIVDFIKKSDEIEKDRDALVKIANNKISDFRQKNLKDEFTEEKKKTLDSFVENILADAQQQVQREIQPKLESLYEKEGQKEIVVEIEESKHKVLLDAFEKFAKGMYNNKAKMVETYEALTG